MSGKYTPLVSIITVTYNAEKYLEKTIISIINQTYKNIEYIIVDGKSRDGTLDLVNKYEKHISKWISEPDEGLFDAMNKGIDLAMGDFVLFMNAGDEIYDDNTLENIFDSDEEYDVYYGEAAMIREDGSIIGFRSELTTQKLPKDLTWKKMDKGMIVCHQSILVRTSIAPKYELKYPIDADIEWVIVALKNAKKIKYSDLIVSKFLANPVLGKFYAGGQATFKGFTKGLIERVSIFMTHYGFFKTVINHFIILFRAIFFRPKKKN